MINVEEKKDKIISYLESNGPSLPVRIAKSISMDPVFASAILSELLSIKKIKLSNMKVGSSPLYLIEGQEQRLEEHSDNLKPLEKDAYLKLKKEIVLSDEEQEPAIRVALRSIKDFAKPFKYQEKIYWRYAFSEDSLVQEKLNPQETAEPEIKEKKSLEEVKTEEVNTEKKDAKEEPAPKIEEDIIKKKDESESLKEAAEKAIEEENLKDIMKKAGVEEKEETVPKAWEVKRAEIIKAKKESNKKIENIFEESEEVSEKPEFYNEVKEFIEKKNLKIVKEIQIEKKEVVARINMSTEIGDLNFLLIAKDKKSVTANEISSALQRAKHEQMPCLYLIRKEPSKKLKSELENTHLIKINILE